MTRAARHLRAADDMDTEERARVAKAADQWRHAVVVCRVNGHSWGGYTVTHRPGLYTIVQRCTRRCGVYREGDMNDQGYMVGPWRPSYPKGEAYLMPKGQGRVTGDGKAELRLMLLAGSTVVEVDDA